MFRLTAFIKKFKEMPFLNFFMKGILYHEKLTIHFAYSIGV
ncbi:hypothetical protein bcere0023_54980 [Bacillus cereus Rock4-2]|nr:hypothetical protein bcere0023_54980 [Bacillus cereus Rock4-2]